MKISENDEFSDQKDYYINVGTVFGKYENSGIGNELDVSGDMVVIGKKDDTSKQDELLKISKAYQDFAKEILLIPVPRSLATFHLRIINSATNTGVAIQNMSKMLIDPIVGLSGTSQYNQYVTEFEASITELGAFLSSSVVQ